MPSISAFAALMTDQASWGLQVRQGIRVASGWPGNGQHPDQWVAAITASTRISSVSRAFSTENSADVFSVYWRG